ncbi:hypothetical protein [Peribacillus kribbensis]|uniref:hypothetical protein n=1 Tax=Peribacillus kribbensis TaxID=356658 RepID=UPI00040100CD|nr:hypothetical protein [Peribacillus kribbensis]
METFYITFYMNNGEKVQTNIVENESYDYSKILERSERWLQVDEKILNLDNVSYVMVTTDTQVKEEEKKANEIWGNMNNIKF